MDNGLWNVLIVDDEPPIRSELRYLLSRDARIGAIDEAGNGTEAVEKLLAGRPDVLFLDIQMPGTSGIKLAETLAGLKTPPAVVFVTAFAEYAAEAFELDAVDFLHKPFAYERFCQALDSFCRRREAMRSGGNLDQSALDSLLHDTIPTALPKGLQPPTLERILDCLRKAGKPLTGEAIAAAAGLSAVTVRRYMAYLLEHHLVAGEMDYSTGGRPCLVYHMIR